MGMEGRREGQIGLLKQLRTLIDNIEANMDLQVKTQSFHSPWTI